MANTKLPARLLDDSVIPAAYVSGTFAVDTNTLRVDAVNNRVGIGITSPDEKLHIKGDGARIYVDSADHNLVSLGRRGSSGASLDQAYLRMKSAGTNTVVIDTAGPSYFNGGNVGIGTTSVDQLLHVEKTSGTTLVKTEVAANSIVGFEIQKTNATTSNWRIVDGQTVNGNLEIYDVTDSRLVTSFDGSGNVLIPNGNVGIGTTSPSSLLELRKTTVGNITGGTGNKGAVLTLHHEAQWESGYTGGDWLGAIDFTTGDASAGEGIRASIRATVDNYYNTNGLTFYTADQGDTTLDSRLRITHDGKVGINNNAPLTQLDVVGGGQIAGTFTRTSSDTASISNVVLVEHETSGNMADGFGPAIFFGTKDGGATTEVASISAVRDGHDNQGAIRLGVKDDTGSFDYDALVVSANQNSTPGLRHRCFAKFDIYNGSQDACVEELGACAAAIYRLHDAVLAPGKYTNGNYYRQIGRDNSSALAYVEFKMNLVKASECYARFKVGNSADGTTRNARLWYSFDGKNYTQADNSSFTSGVGESSYTLDLTNKLHGHVHYTGSVYWRCGLVDGASGHVTLIGWDYFEFRAFAESMTFDSGGYERGVTVGSESLITTTGQGVNGTQINYVPNRPYAHMFTRSSAYSGNTTSLINSFVSAGQSFLNEEIMKPVSSPQSGIQFYAEGTVFYSFSQDMITSGSTSYARANIFKYNAAGNANHAVGYHLMTNTGGQWDGLTGSGVFDVNPGDIIRFEMAGGNITNMDGNTWSYYNFLWMPPTTSGVGNCGGNANFPFVGNSFS